MVSEIRAGFDLSYPHPTRMDAWRIVRKHPLY